MRTWGGVGEGRSWQRRLSQDCNPQLETSDKELSRGVRSFLGGLLLNNLVQKRVQKRYRTNLHPFMGAGRGPCVVKLFPMHELSHIPHLSRTDALMSGIPEPSQQNPIKIFSPFLLCCVSKSKRADGLMHPSQQSPSPLVKARVPF